MTTSGLNSRSAAAYSRNWLRSARMVRKSLGKRYHLPVCPGSPFPLVPRGRIPLRQFYALMSPQTRKIQGCRQDKDPDSTQHLVLDLVVLPMCCCSGGGRVAQLAAWRLSTALVPQISRQPANLCHSPRLFLGESRQSAVSG